MFSVGDAVVYGTQGVCRISDITDITVDKVIRKYFVLSPVYSGKATLYVPVDNEEVIRTRMRPVFTIDEIDSIIKNVSEGKTMPWIANDARRKEFCMNTLKSGDRMELVRLIGMLYSHQADMKAQNKLFHISDERYLKEAETLINEEFAFVLGIELGEVKKYIAKKIKK